MSADGKAAGKWKRERFAYMNYTEARACIQESQRFGHEMGLKAITILLERMGNPQQDLKFIHIAGTNGKGSVNAHLASALKEAGYRVGRFVSPTLYGYRERIQINDEWISRDDFAEGMTVLWPVLEGMTGEGLPCPTPFEIETALSFWYFKQKGCDLVALECGLGGETDATNVIRTTVLSILTSISMDHMEYLGDTPEKIARTKAGILKPGAVMITGRQMDCVTETIRQVCREKNNQLIIGDPDQAEVISSSLEQQIFTYKGLTAAIHLAGAHQIDNAVIAIEALRELNNHGFTVTDGQIAAGLEKTVWNGRFTRVSKEPDFLVDGAHNPDAAARLKAAIEQYYPGRRLIFIIGMYKDKQVHTLMELMAPMAEQIFTIEASNNDYNRVLPKEKLAEVIREFNPAVLPCDTIKTAVDKARQCAKTDGVIVAFGSLSFIGELTAAATENTMGE